MNPILPDKSVLDKCFTHFGLLHGAGSLPGVYFFHYGGSFGAKQVTPVGVDAYPVDGRDAYYCAFPQSVAPAPGKRGKKATVTGAGAFFTEFDGQDFLTEDEIAPFHYVDLADPKRNSEAKAWTTAKKGALTQSPAFFAEVLQRIRAKIASLPIAPSSILASGGGFHCFWYFDNPVRFDNDATRLRFEAALESWVTFNGGDGGAKDIDRVLRVPGTVNAKGHYVRMAGAPLPVTWESFDADRRYSYEALCGAMPATWDAPAQAAKVRQTRKFTGASAPTPARTAGSLPDLPAVRRFNATERIDDWLTKTGCTFVRFDGEGDRWLPPQSTTGNPAIWRPNGKNFVWSFSEHNPVGRDGKLSPADFAIAHDFGGNVEAFVASLQTAAVAPDQAGDSEPAIDWTALKAQAATMDIRPHVAARLAQLAELAVKEAEAAAAAYAANPTDQTEAAALALRKSADKLIAQAANPPHSMLMKLRRLIPIVLERFEYADHKYGQLDGIRIPVGGVAEKFKGEDATREYLNLLEGWLLTPLHKVRGRAAKYAVNVAVFREVGHKPSVDDQTSREMTTLVAQITHPGHDAFRRLVTPRRRTGFQYMLVAATADAIRNGYNVEPLPGESLTDVIADGPGELRRDAMPDEKTRHMQAAGYLHEQTARLAADLASIGDAGVSLVTHLQQAGGLMTGADLARLLDNMNRFAFSKLVKRCIDAGIVRKPDRSTVELLPDWADRLDESAKLMPTYADSAIATARHLDTSEAYQAERLTQAQAIADETQDKATFAQMELRILAIKKTLATLQNLRMELILWAAEALSVSHSHKAARIFKRYASKAEREAVDQANRAAAGRRRLHSIETAAANRAAWLRSWELPEEQIAAKLMIAGYSQQTVAAVLL